ncbi:Filamin-binding LIM protein 1 [Chytriomyces hyalinus]|nr:Filamin-binding LIM protein 1 [Chytriomyces hyalinus]
MAAVLPPEPTTLNAPASVVTSSAAAAAAKIAVILERHERDMTMIHHPEFRGHCESCNDAVLGSDGVSYKFDNLTRYYHQKCFRCHICTQSLRDGGEFFLHVGNPHCIACYQEKVLGCCDACGKVLMSQQGVLRARSKKFHPACFTCKQCLVKLDGRFYEKDDSFWCRTCYVDMFVPNCGSCTKKILPDVEGQAVTTIDWKGKKYHAQCFGCVDCSKIFTDLKAYQIDGNLFCKNCHSIRTKKGTRVSVGSQQE